MQLGDFVAIATFVLTILGLAFALGQQAYRLQTLEKDLNEIASTQRKYHKELSETLRQQNFSIDSRLDKLGTFAARTDQRIVHLEERLFGEDTAARMRAMDS